MNLVWDDEKRRVRPNTASECSVPKWIRNRRQRARPAAAQAFQNAAGSATRFAWDSSEVERDPLLSKADQADQNSRSRTTPNKMRAAVECGKQRSRRHSSCGRLRTDRPGDTLPQRQRLINSANTASTTRVALQQKQARPNTANITPLKVRSTVGLGRPNTANITPLKVRSTVGLGRPNTASTAALKVRRTVGLGRPNTANVTPLKVRGSAGEEVAKDDCRPAAKRDTRRAATAGVASKAKRAAALSEKPITAMLFTQRASVASVCELKRGMREVDTKENQQEEHGDSGAFKEPWWESKFADAGVAVDQGDADGGGNKARVL